jgi:hypothetical protein
VKNPFPRAAESPCEAVEGLEPGSPADAGAGRDRQPGRHLTPSSVRGYESGVLKVNKEIPDEILHNYIENPRKTVPPSVALRAWEVENKLRAEASALYLQNVPFVTQ